MYGSQEEEKEGRQKDVLTRPEDGPIAERPAPILTMRHKHEIHELARKVKGTYCQLMRLCKELDITFPS